MKYFITMKAEKMETVHKYNDFIREKLNIPLETLESLTKEFEKLSTESKSRDRPDGDSKEDIKEDIKDEKAVPKKKLKVRRKSSKEPRDVPKDIPKEEEEVPITDIMKYKKILTDSVKNKLTFNFEELFGKETTPKIKEAIRVLLKDILSHSNYVKDIAENMFLPLSPPIIDDIVDKFFLNTKRRCLFCSKGERCNKEVTSNMHVRCRNHTAKVQCVGITAKGTRCSKTCYPDDRYCCLHNEETDAINTGKKPKPKQPPFGRIPKTEPHKSEPPKPKGGGLPGFDDFFKQFTGESFYSHTGGGTFGKVPPKPSDYEEKSRKNKEEYAKERFSFTPPVQNEALLLSKLGLKLGATNDDIKAAFRKQALVCHPDKGGSVEKFKELNDAYSSLKGLRNIR